MSKKPILLFQPTTPNGDLPLKYIIEAGYHYLAEFDKDYRDKGKGVGRLILGIGSCWNGSVNELYQVETLAKICSSLHLHFVIEKDHLDRVMNNAGEYLHEYFDKLRKILDTQPIHALLVTGLNYELIRDYVQGVCTVESITVVSSLDPESEGAARISPIHRKRTIGEYDELEGIDFNS